MVFESIQNHCDTLKEWDKADKAFNENPTSFRLHWPVMLAEVSRWKAQRCFPSHVMSKVSSTTETGSLSSQLILRNTRSIFSSLWPLLAWYCSPSLVTKVATSGSMILMRWIEIALRLRKMRYVSKMTWQLPVCVESRLITDLHVWRLFINIHKNGAGGCTYIPAPGFRGTV